ncbi:MULTISPECIES: ATP-binding cassette domain-containing protein [unclassified Streptomyces]|uniref:ATP-binding cassette domain-containing protein n=1 Tax=unclassified Streptomyces TaxID=2593676 RepID=UPI0022B71AD8|nr:MULTISPECIES: ATP-binding cassette domain-containing protein [unclassified Streptomyces]MCZ7413789.1 ATP-binding cassette domain-containing protein [Streptomyces sp. WMMC897]MCZ7430785.1 ATP-binding cassette domain-containing protein [Streptomyces sp. WMMC1477]
MEGAEVSAERLGLTGSKGTVFEAVDVDAPPGALIAVTGPSGSGRTCLLLTLTGRMRPTTGHASVGGHRIPSRMGSVRRIAALGPVPGVTDLEPSWTVTEQLRERALLRRRLGFGRRERAAERRARVDRALERAGLDPDTLPKGPRTAVRDLERLEALRLGTALALLDEPRLLAVDDADLKLADEEREQLWELLRSVSGAGTTVLAVCSEPPPDALVLGTARGGGDTDEEGIGEGEAQDALTETGRA